MGAPGGLSGSEARVPEPPRGMLLRGLVTGFRGPGGGARLDIWFTMDCKALGLREGTWDRGHQGESLGGLTRRGQEGRGKAPRQSLGKQGWGGVQGAPLEARWESPPRRRETSVNPETS